MKKFIVILIASLAMTLYAAPRNNPVVQPSVWNGYGDVDWCFASVRIGIANKDSLLEDGWALIDSLNLKYGEIDSINVTNFGADTISTIYLFADTASIATGNGTDLTLINNGTMNDLVVNDSASVTTSLDVPDMVTFGGGNIDNLVNIFRFEPVTNKGYIQYNNTDHTFTIRQDSTLVAGNTDMSLTFREEDNTAHSIQWADAFGYFYTNETLRVLHLIAATNVYLGAGQISVATTLVEPAGHYWAGLATVNSGYDGVLLDPNLGGQDTVKVGVTGDNDIFVSECSENWFDADLKITDYSLTAGALVSETVDARPVVMQWTGQVTHADFTAASVSEVILIIDDFPAKYKIIEVIIDITQVFDDAGGAIDAATISFGSGAGANDVLAATDCYTAVTRIGDAAGEVAYTSIQNGHRPSWSSATDLSVKLTTANGNVDACTTGIADIYITYIAIE